MCCEAQKAFRKSEARKNPTLKTKDIKFRVSEHRQRIQAKQLAYKFQETYYPEGWLTFILGGHRILNDGKMLSCLQEMKELSPSPGLNYIAQLGLMERNSLPAKAVRASLANNFAKNGDMQTPSSNGSTSPRSVSSTSTSTIIHRIEEPPRDDSEQLAYWTLQLIDSMDKEAAETNLIKKGLYKTLMINAETKVIGLTQTLNIE